MPRWGEPLYQQIAGDYRAKILDGVLVPGEKLPSETELMAEYEVSRVVARRAIDVLRNEGLIVSHTGRGSFVKEVRRIVRDSSTRYSRQKAASTSPFKSDATKSGQQGGWEHASSRTTASASVARRLGLDEDAPVMQTTYRYLADGEPIQLSTSWEPLEVTGGTPIEFPEESPTVGVVARMDLIGQHVTEVIEKVHARAARPEEAERLNLPAHTAYVLVIERTHFVGSKPVETCDIVFPGDRYELTYRLPVT